MDKNETLTINNSSSLPHDKKNVLPEIKEKNEEYLLIDSNTKFKGTFNKLSIDKNDNLLNDINEGDIQPIMPKNMSGDKLITESDILSHTNLVNNSTINRVKDEIKSICSKIFLNFSKFSKIDKEYFLSQQSLLKIMRGVNLIDDKTLQQNDVDILFKKVSVSGKRLNLNQFLNLIILISKKIDKQSFKKDPKIQIITIVKTFFEPYAKYIEGQGTINNSELASNNILIKNSIEMFIQNFNYDFTIISIIDSIYPGLKEIYLAYFSSEIKLNSAEKITPLSFQGLLDFGKDFEVLPCFCSVNQIVIYWNVIIKMNPSEITRNKQHPDLIDPKKDLGQVFTLSKFASMIIYLSVLTFYKYNIESTNSVSNGEKLIFFLEKLENSNGFQTMEKRLNKFHTTSNSLIPPKDIILLVNPAISKENNFIDDKKTEEESRKIKEYNEKIRNSGEEGYDLRSLMSIIPEAFLKLESKMDVIKEIFLNYCSYGSKLNNQKLSFSSYLKFLKDCDLIYIPLPKQKEKKVDNRENRSYVNKVEKKDKSSVDDKKKKKYRKEYRNIRSLEDIEFNIEKIPKVKKTIVPQGKVLESEVMVIFYNLTGHKNFDNSDKIKSQFDKNVGAKVNIETNQNVSTPMIDPSKSFKINHENSPLKMDFCLFLKSFEYISRKIYPDVNLDHGFALFLDIDLKNLLEKRKEEIFTYKKKITEIWNSLKREEIVDILKDIHPLVFPFYENFCNNEALLNYEKFLEFYKDFLIFPEVLSLFQIKSLFFSLSDIYSAHSYQPRTKSYTNFDPNKSLSSIESTNKIKKSINSNKYINYDLFLESLAITAIMFKGINLNFSDSHKILYLLERINSSEAIKNCKLKTGQFFYSSKECTYHKELLRTKYHEFYNPGKARTDMDFNELFA